MGRLSSSISHSYLPNIMLTSSLSRLLSLCSLVYAFASLTACGGNVDATSVSATAAPVFAANVAQTPVADCEPQACQGLRIIDSNAETFRADTARRDALAMAVANMESNPAH
jgi:hypothetical protein